MTRFNCLGVAGVVGLTTVMALGCKGRGSNENAAAAVTVAPPPPAYDSGATCTATGQWAVCSVMYRLQRAGFGVTRDSQPIREAALAQTGMRLHLGKGTLTVFIYPDTANRHRDEVRLDPKLFVAPEAEWIQGKRTLIHSANLLGLLDVGNGRTRERISDALQAGPPQAAAPVTLAPTKGR